MIRKKIKIKVGTHFVAGSVLVCTFAGLGLLLLVSVTKPISAEAAYRFDSFSAKPPIHVLKASGKAPQGLSPNVVKLVYHLPQTGGMGTIAIIGAYADSHIEKDLAVFDTAFKLPACTVKNKCLEEHPVSSAGTSTSLVAQSVSSDWNMETSLDIEWAHAIAPQAKILFVEAKTPSGANLLKAIDYARSRADVVAVSMSWGGAEFSDEVSLDSHFVDAPSSNTKIGISTTSKLAERITFFASSGDEGTGASWPASSPMVVSVGGTSLHFSNSTNVTSLATSTKSVKLLSETAWAGSGGGISAYEAIPLFQKNYSLPKNKGMRSIPDVAYNADPASGYSIYDNGVWYVVGGTSAGAPQWAAIKSLGLSADNTKFYADKAKSTNNLYFKDIVSGSNGTCGYICTARKRYDYVTGLGSPLTVTF